MGFNSGFKELIGTVFYCYWILQILIENKESNTSTVVTGMV